MSAAAGAWGAVEIIPNRRDTRVVLTVLHGRISLRQLVLTTVGQINLPRIKTLAVGKTHAFVFKSPS